MEKVHSTSHANEISCSTLLPKEGNIVIDAGAHISRCCVLQISQTKRNCCTYPSRPGNFDPHNENIVPNELSNILPINCAAYSKQAVEIEFIHAVVLRLWKSMLYLSQIK